MQHCMRYKKNKCRTLSKIVKHNIITDMKDLVVIKVKHKIVVIIKIISNVIMFSGKKIKLMCTI